MTTSTVQITDLPSLSVMSDSAVIPVQDSGVTKKITGAVFKSYVTPINITGSSTTSTYAQTVIGAAQPNITSVGTLTALRVTTSVTATTFVGTLTTAAQPSITSVGTLTGLTSTGTVNIIYTPSTGTSYAIIATGKDTQGGTGYFDFLKATNTASGATNPSKSFRLSSDGQFQIINSSYTTNILNLTDAGVLSVPGSYSVNFKKAVNGPAFSAYAEATLQTITSGSQTKVLFQTEEFDTDGCYAGSRFTPTVEGYYQLNAQVRLDGSSGTGEIMIVLYKNTSEHKRGTNQSGTSIATNFWAMQVSALVYANGTTDYFEIKVQQTSGGSMTVTAVNNPVITWFNGSMVRGA